MWLLLLLRLLGAAATAAAAARDPSSPTPGAVPGAGMAVGGDAEGIQGPIAVDRSSGCSCKRSTPGLVLCFDLVACVRFPSNVTVPPSRGLATLLVRSTRIPRLAPGDLAGLTHLTELALDNSQAMERVVPFAFQGMSLLVNLSVSFHPRLAHLEADALAGLASLRRLSLVRNGFLALAGDVVPALRPAVLPSLRALALDENGLREVAAGDFLAMEGSPVEQLSLAGCYLAAVHPDALAPLRRLAELRLADNNLNVSALAASLDRMRAAGLALRTLDLDAIGLAIGLRGTGADAGAEAGAGRLTEGVAPNATATTTTITTTAATTLDAHLQLLQAIAKSPVTELVLRHNEVERLWPGSWPRMPGLRRLDLSHVDLTEGRAGALAADVVPALQALNLSGNRLPGLVPGFVSDRLLSLDMSWSRGAYFDPGEGAFAGMARLQALHLSYNRILRLTNATFVGLDSLQVLTLCNASLYNLDDGVFAPLRRLEHLDLQRNLFSMYRPLRADVFLGLGRLRVLLLASCGLRSLGPDAGLFLHLPALVQLGLQDNALATLDGSRAFRPLRALQRLDVSRNRIGSWRRRLFGHNEALREVRAAGNTLTYLSEAMLQDLTGLEAVDLADNTFHCGCDLYLEQGLDRGLELHGANATRLLKYTCLSPEPWRGRSLAEYVQWAARRSGCVAATAVTTPTLLLIALPLGLLLLLAVVVGVLAYRHRRHLRYYCEAVVASRRGRAGVGTAAYINYQYDAFVSYSSEDQAFVHRLVTALEGEPPHFRLCVYERDFAVGTAITEAVLNSVALSRRVVLVVSQAFTRSHWCAWETHIAHHQRLLAEDALLVVRLGAVDESLLTPTLRYLMQVRIYLEWPVAAPWSQGGAEGEGRGSAEAAADRQLEEVFWRKLRAALGPPLQQHGGGAQLNCPSSPAGPHR